MRHILFIHQVIQGDLLAFKYWMLALSVMGVLVIIAALIDLRYGRMASKVCGVYKTTSYGLRKTVYKIKDYLTFLMFGAMIDVCASFFVSYPVCSAIITIGVLLIEGLSVREKINSINEGHDPLQVAKAIANAYGITDSSKMDEILKSITKKEGENEGE